MMMTEKECECPITSLNFCVVVAGPGHHGVAVPVVISLGWWWSPLLLSVTVSPHQDTATHCNHCQNITLL